MPKKLNPVGWNKQRKLFLKSNNISERVDRWFWIAIAGMSFLFILGAISEVLR